jgi:hypothetical protein
MDCGDPVVLLVLEAAVRLIRWGGTTWDDDGAQGKGRWRVR